MSVNNKSNYKFKITERDDGFVFVLYPNNSNTQPIGVSGDSFSNKALCERALSIFRDIVKSNPYDLLNYGKRDEKIWEPSLNANGKKIFYRTIPYEEKQSCEAWLKEITDNIDAELR